VNTHFQCPRCGSAELQLESELEAAQEAEAGAHGNEAQAWLCRECRSRYPIVCGIPDFRTAPDPYIDLEADRQKARGLAERFEQLDLAGLVDHYFAITPEVPPKLAERYRIGLLESGPDRVAGLLALTDQHAGTQPRQTRVLELACGSGPFLPALAERFDEIVGVDIALRWLVVARKRLIELGIGEDVQLVCACAEALPFATDRFDLCIAANAIEHLRDAPLAMREVGRTLSPDGTAAFTTPNRFSPGPDPHVGIWGIGFLPHAWQDKLARRTRGAGLLLIRTRGYGELRRLLAQSGLTRSEFALPALAPANLAHQGVVGRTLGRLYNTLRSWPVARPLLLRLGPLFQIVARR